MTTRTKSAVVALMVTVLCTAPVWAGEEKATGTATYAPASMETVQLADGGVMQRSHIKGIVLADDPSVSLHLASQDCFGTTVVSADGVAVGNGYCDAVDAEGDRWWLWWHNGPDGNKWGFMGGTGKYEGIKGGGTTETVAQMADGRSAITWEGHWKIP